MTDSTISKNTIEVESKSVAHSTESEVGLHESTSKNTPTFEPTLPEFIQSKPVSTFPIWKAPTFEQSLADRANQQLGSKVKTSNEVLSDTIKSAQKPECFKDSGMGLFGMPSILNKIIKEKCTLN